MAHPYSTVAAYENLVGADFRLKGTSLEGSVDTTVFAAVLEKASNYIDARLAQVYVVPFAATSATPATPGIVADLAHDLCTYEILRRQGLRDLAKLYYDDALAMIESLVSGESEIPGATKVAAEAGRTPLAYSAGKPVFAGRENTGVDNTTDTPRWRW